MESQGGTTKEAWWMELGRSWREADTTALNDSEEEEE
jgi:hypothetical protein